MATRATPPTRMVRGQRNSSAAAVSTVADNRDVAVVGGAQSMDQRPCTLEYDDEPECEV